MSTLNKFGHSAASQPSNNIQPVNLKIIFLQDNIKRLEEKILQVESFNISNNQNIKESLADLDKKILLIESEIQDLLQLKKYGYNLNTS